MEHKALTPVSLDPIIAMKPNRPAGKPDGKVPPTPAPAPPALHAPGAPDGNPGKPDGPAHAAPPAGPPAQPPRRGPGRPPKGTSDEDRPPRRADMPLNIIKIIRAVEDKGLTRSNVEKRAGWFPNRIYDWEYKGGELTAQQAWQASFAIDIPFQYIVDDDVPLASPPPSRAIYDNTSFVERAASMGLTAQQAIEGLRLIATCNDHNITISQANRYITTLIGEIAAERLAEQRQAEKRPPIDLIPEERPAPPRVKDDDGERPNGRRKSS